MNPRMHTGDSFIHSLFLPLRPTAKNWWHMLQLLFIFFQRINVFAVIAKDSYSRKGCRQAFEMMIIDLVNWALCHSLSRKSSKQEFHVFNQRHLQSICLTKSWSFEEIHEKVKSIIYSMLLITHASALQFSYPDPSSVPRTPETVLRGY